MKRKCDFCGNEFEALDLDEKWFEENGCYCSNECRYEDETGKPGEEY